MRDKISTQNWGSGPRIFAVVIAVVVGVVGVQRLFVLWYNLLQLSENYVMPDQTRVSHL